MYQSLFSSGCCIFLLILYPTISSSFPADFNIDTLQLKCTIDTCDPSKPIINNGPKSMCVNIPIVCKYDNKCNGVFVCEEATGQCKIDQPFVNCNDNNTCTIDTCVTSMGQCTNATNCNDSDPCTVNDTCDTTVGCATQPPLDNCCGNFKCKSIIFESP